MPASKPGGKSAIAPARAREREKSYGAAPRNFSRYALRLEFPDGKNFDYAVRTFKFLDHGIGELEEMGLGILLPFSVLKLRKSAARAKTPERRAELAGEMRTLVDDLMAAVERSERAGAISESDKRSVLELTERLYRELFAQYDEFREADEMLRDTLLTYSEEAELRGIEAGVEKVARSMLVRGMSLTEVAEISELPMEQLRALIQ